MPADFWQGLGTLGEITQGADRSAYNDLLRQMAMQQLQQARLQQRSQAALLPTLRALSAAPQQTAPPGPTPLPQQIQQQQLPPPQQIASLPQLPQTGGGMGPVTPLPQSANVANIPGLPPGGGTVMNQFPISTPPQTRGGGFSGDFPQRLTPEQVAAASGPSPGMGFSAPQLGIQDRAGADPTRMQLASADQTYRQLRTSMPPQVQQPAMQGARDILSSMGNPLQFAGRLGLDDLVKAVDKANPNAPDEVKSAIFTNLYPMLNTQGKLGFSEAIQLLRLSQQKEEFTFSKKQQQEQFTQRQQDLEEQRRFNRMIAEDKLTGAGREKYLTSKQLEITNPDTGATRTVLAREKAGGVGWVDSMTGQPLAIAPNEQIKEVTASTSGGGRAGAQVQRQVTAGAEVKADLQNVSSMPVGTTTGLFGGVAQGKSLLGALQGDLAIALTPEDAVNMKMAMAGVGRELSTLMSPVYSGNWASEQLEPLIPKAGYSVLNSLYGIARIRQSADNALDSLQPSPILSDKQKEYARSLKKQIDEAIPWSVQDVIAFQKGESPQETFGEFAGRTVQGSGETNTMDVIPAVKNDPDGTGYSIDGSVWVKRGDKLIKQRGAVETPR